eukprot:scpid68350/ scgid3629/ 
MLLVTAADLTAEIVPPVTRAKVCTFMPDGRPGTAMEELPHTCVDRNHGSGAGTRKKPVSTPITASACVRACVVSRIHDDVEDGEHTQQVQIRTAAPLSVRCVRP